MTLGIPSRGNSAISKRKPVGNIEINRDLNFGKPSPHSKPTPVGFKTNVSYKSIGANYSSMFGKKERESSKESRSSQRRPSNNTSSKAQIYKPQLGKEKLTKLLQPSTPSERFMKSTDQAEKARGTAGNSTKRKNSSSNSINKKSNLEPRSSIAGKSTSKIIPVMAGGLSYLSAKSTQDLKKEILANKMIGNMRMIKKPEDTRPTTKGNPTILSSLITQVAKPVAIKHESPQNGATLNTDKSSKTLKKKKKSSKENPAVKLSLKNEGIFYMHKLELSFKECGEDEESSLFRLHFKNTIQSLSLLSSVSKTVAPYEDKQKIHMPPLKSPSIKRNNLDMKTIIFDLDETLIHCNEDQDNPCDARVPVSFPTGDFIEVTMTYRGRNQHPAIRQGGFTGVIKDV